MKRLFAQKTKKCESAGEAAKGVFGSVSTAKHLKSCLKNCSGDEEGIGCR